MNIGRIIALSIRPQGAAAPQRLDAVDAIAGSGLAHDGHADPSSPRQVLLADAGTYSQLELPEHTLRENLLLDVDTAQLRSGTVLHIGDDVLLRLMFQCEACGQLDRYRQGLARALGPRRGMLARVLKGGVIREGDAVRVSGICLPAWSDDWRERVRRVLNAAPPDAVVEYAQLARLAGVQSSYCRAFPRMLAKLGPGYARKAVARQAPPSLVRWNGNGLFDDAPAQSIQPSAIS
ncbi:MOSC domain-containing protein [Massilia sp. 9096]|uniref:MOSC domain-containing protein n=1 Tax=Massilia sp. 9096 TaxID=1500894 RepID=UPI00056A3A50|nr:MOSC domain-containing protein [Massilia sp. 9096]